MFSYYIKVVLYTLYQYTLTTLQLYCVLHLGDNCVQNFHFGRYIVGYTVGNLVLWRSVSVALKHDFQKVTLAVG